MLHITHSFIDTTQDLTTHSLTPLIHSLNTRSASHHSLTDTTQNLTTHPTHSLTQHKICFTPLHSTYLHSTPLHSSHLHSTPLHPLHSTHSTPLHSTPLPQSLTHSLTPRTQSTLSLAAPRAFRRACGARCRRWAPRCRRWAPLALCSGRRSSQSLQKGLRRAFSPPGPPHSLQRQAQYPEPPEGASARVVAAGPPSLSAVAGAVSTQSLQKGLRRALSPGPLRLCA